MAKTSYALELVKRKTRMGKYPINIRITENRKSRRIRSSVLIDSIEDWNDRKGEVRKSNPNSVKWNDTLKRELETVKDKREELHALSLDQFYDELQITTKKIARVPPEEMSFLDFARGVAEQKKETNSLAHYHNILNVIKNVESFLKETRGYSTSMKVSNVSPKFLYDFHRYLHTMSNVNIKDKKSRLHPNTIATKEKRLRCIVNQAVKLKLIPKTDNPFDDFSIHEIDTHKDALTLEEFNLLKDAEVSKGSWQDLARDAFLFSYYCAGIRASDLLQLRWSNVHQKEGRIDYTMGKNGKVKGIALSVPAKKILEKYYKEGVKKDDYIFPFLNSDAKYAQESVRGKFTMSKELQAELEQQISSKNVLINKYLKKLAETLEIETPISMHIARHTFATTAKENGFSSRDIQSLLNHSSLSTTEKYLDSLPDAQVASRLNNLFETNTRAETNAIEEETPKVDVGSLLKSLGSLSEADRELLRKALA